MIDTKGTRDVKTREEAAKQYDHFLETLVGMDLVPPSTWEAFLVAYMVAKKWYKTAGWVNTVIAVLLTIVVMTLLSPWLANCVGR